MRRFFRTILDIGFYRLFLRLRYEIRILIDKSIPSRVALFISNGIYKNPGLVQYSKPIGYFDSPKDSYLFSNKLFITFNFLNERKKLNLEFNWNNKAWSRLWQFHLHYFDWAREWLEIRINNNSWPKDAKFLSYLIDRWIKFNPAGRGDGWNSYTLSLRIRNLIWIYLTCPNLQTKKRINSLWEQLCWLNSHIEYCYGGNHLLENLISIALVSLQFKGKKANIMYKNAMKKLKNELKEQILNDGGHHERSAGYHILILDRLIELGCMVEFSNKYRPSWLIKSIKKMKDWACLVKLEDQTFPRFNDSAIDSCPKINDVILFANSYLSKTDNNSKGLRRLLVGCNYKNNKPTFKNKELTKSPNYIDLPNTGWMILRPGKGWELLFKCGKPCPNHLPPHVHSDLLSFDLFKKGNPLFAETGTSVYGNGKDRQYERSGAAHNLIQFSKSLENVSDHKWIEAVDVWGGFRAGRKAKITERNCGLLNDGTLWVSGSHDGFKKIGLKHKRILEIKAEESERILFNTTDHIYCSRPITWRQWWHLGPKISKEFLNELINQIEVDKPFKVHSLDTWYSFGFGKRLKRKSLYISGFFGIGNHSLKSKLVIPSQPFI